MTYQELLASAKENFQNTCKACPVCNGAACRGLIPGPGGKGTGEGFVRSFQKLAEIKLNLDTIYEEKEPDLSFDFFGHRVAMPVFAAPIGAMPTHYGPLYTEKEYVKELVEGLSRVGLMAFTGDGAKAHVFADPVAVLSEYGGLGIPTIKPWPVAVMREKLKMAEAIGAPAVAVDVDASGLQLLKNVPTPVSAKSVEELSAFIAGTKLPVILKGIMTVRGAEKALQCGAAGIVVSNHGGRVLDQTPAPVEVLPAIVRAVGGRMKIFIDGAIRTGADVFKVLALGADAVLIGRPYPVAVYGGGADGAELYSRKIEAELRDVMLMTGASSLCEITREKVWLDGEQNC